MNSVPPDFNNQIEPNGGILGEIFVDYNPPSWDVYFMRMAYEVATKSKDPSSKVGAVIVRDKRPLLFGYNGIPPKVNDYLERYKKPVKYKWIVHAEQNALHCAAKYGIATENTILYVPMMPCARCAGSIISCGISKIVLHVPAVDVFSKVSHYGEDNDVTKMSFSEAGVEIAYVNGFVGKVAYIGGRKYNV